MKNLKLIFALLLAAPLGAQTMLNPSAPTNLAVVPGGPVFSPVPGTYSSTQSVSISGCTGGQDIFYRTDGGPVTIASKRYSSPISVAVSQTIVAMCATVPAYQTNVQSDLASAECGTIGGVGTGNGTPCSNVTPGSGGIGNNAFASVVWNVASTATINATTLATTTGETQGLFGHLYSGGADPAPPSCDYCTTMVQDFVLMASAGTTTFANIETDMPQYDNTHNANRQNGWQCEQSGGDGTWNADAGSNSGGWNTSGIPCAYTAGVPKELVLRVTHSNTDTSCGGHGVAHYTDFWDAGTYHNLSSYVWAHCQGYGANPNNYLAWGVQTQPDFAPATGTAKTGILTLTAETVAMGIGDEGPLASGPYVIGQAIPIIEPNNNVVGQYALAAPSPVLAFGSQGISTSSPAIKFSISNPANAQFCTYFGIGCGLGSVTVTSMTITGTNASDFTLAGTCTTIASNADCEPTIAFKPTAAVGTNETATFTANYTNSAVTSQTMSLTGKSVTPTALSATSNPTALSGSTNYQVSTAITAGGTNFTFGSTATDVNIDGSTLTFGNTTTASQVNQFATSAFNTGITVHNGNFNYGAGTNTKGAGHPESSGIGYTGSFNVASGVTIFNTDFTYSIQFSNAVEDNNGFLIFHDNQVNDTAVGTCAVITCRNQLFAVPVYQFNVSTRPSGSSLYYNNYINGGPQGGLDAAAPGTVVSYNTINPGNVAGNNTNDFGIYAWGFNDQIYDNVICTPLATNCNARGIQISAAQSPGITGVAVFNNIIGAYETPFNSEYSGCQVGGAYGLQFDDNPVGPNAAYNNYVVAYAKACSGGAFRVTDSEYLTNVSHDNIYIATRLSGATTCVRHPDNAPQPGCANASEWDGPTGLTSLRDTYTGDSCDILLDVSGGSGIVVQSPTFNQGANLSDFHTFCATNGTVAEGGGPVTNFHVIDATFHTGTSSTDTDFPLFNVGNQGDVSLYIDWTQTLTVKKTSGPVVVGAVVTYTDVLANNYTCTTNSSGTCSVILTQYRNNNDTAANAHENHNPYSLSIPASGCTTYTQSAITVSATGAATITLLGC